MNKFKKLTLVVFFVLFSFILSFVIGTFVPNFHTKGNIIKETELLIKKELFALDFFEPEFNYDDSESFIKAVDKCVNYLNFKVSLPKRIPSELIIAQSSLESNYGKSRFSVEANNILGIRTFNKEDKQIKSKKNPDSEWGIKVFDTKCDCIRYYIHLLNNHKAYSEFRELRIKQSNEGVIDAIELAKTLTNYATDENYIEKLIDKIKEIKELNRADSLGIRG
tara:strand:+ start:52 stop:717 length:666 start_codon:yes stop_codon:yes gene_type:complete